MFSTCVLNVVIFLLFNLGRTAGTNNCYFYLQGFLLGYLLLDLYNYLTSLVPVRLLQRRLCLISILVNACLRWTLARSKFEVCGKQAFRSLCIPFPVVLGVGCFACVAVGYHGRGLVCRLALACDEHIHVLKHCIHRLFIGHGHQLKLSLMLLLEEGKHHSGGLAFFLCCCQLLGCEGCILEPLMFCGGLRVLSLPKPFFRKVILEILPGLLRGGFVLPCNHLVLGEHLALPHSRACRHCHLLDAWRDAAVSKGGLKLVEAGEVGCDACCWIPLLPISLGLVLELLGGGHLDCHLLMKV